MTVYMLRRRKLGKTSCGGIVAASTQITGSFRSDQPVPADATMIIRWGTTSNVGVNNVVNRAEAIHLVSDKTKFRQVLMEKAFEGEMDSWKPPLCPTTIFEVDDLYHDNYQMEFPLIVRPRVHAQGKHVYLVNNLAELQIAISKCGPGWYASKYINKVAEYRITFVQGRVAWVAKKTPANPQAIAWNVAQGGRFDNVNWSNWPLRAVKTAREAFLLSGLDFGAVDIMVDAEGRPYVLEINSAPSQTSPYRQQCMAKAFDYLIVNGKAPIPVIEEKGGYRKFIHPGVCAEAQMV